MRGIDRDIALVERAYDLSGTLDEWLDALHAAIEPHLDAGHGVGVGAWVLENGRVRDLSKLRGSVSPRAARVIARQVELLPPEVVRMLYAQGAREFIGSAGDFDGRFSQSIKAAFTDAGCAPIVDLLGVQIVGNPGRNGVAFSAPISSPRTLSSVERRRFRRFMTHVSAGLRLRLSLASSARAPDAVLDSSGRLLHGSDEATTVPARESLRQAVRDIERSRGQLRRSNPDEALSLWKGLVAARWSIVDWVDTDSRRYLVAHRNQVSLRDPRALTARELDVAEYVVQGRTTSEVAYALGLTAGTVSRLCRDVLRKLGCARRADLASIFGSVAPFRAELDPSGDVIAMSPGSNDSLWHQLSPSQRDVVSRSLRGEAVAQIARARSVSRKTVSNQLGATYAMFGVRGRTELATLLGHVPRGTGEAR